MRNNQEEKIEFKKEFITFEVIQENLGLKNPILFKEYLRFVFNDISCTFDKNKIKYLSRLDFYNYINLPILIAEKLFLSLSQSKEGLTETEFVFGLFKLYMGSFQYTSEVIFNLLDFDKDGIIHKEDAKLILSHLPLIGLNEDNNSKIFNTQMKSLGEIDTIVNEVFNKFKNKINFSQFIDIVRNINSEIFLQIICYLYQQVPFNSRKVEELIKKYILYMKDEDFEQISKDYRISKNSKAIKLKLPKYTSLVSPVGSFIKKYQIKNKIIFFDWKDSSKEEKQNLQENNNNIIIDNIQKENKNDIYYENWIYEIINDNELKKMYAVLENKDIFLYKSENKSEFLGLHNLSGCFVQETSEKKIIEGVEFFSFEIIGNNKTKKGKYYSTEEKIKKEFVEKIKIAIGHSKFSDLYEIKEVIGKGKFGVVNSGIHKKTGQKVAIKIINKKDIIKKEDKELVVREIGILKVCHHPNIVRLLDHLENIDYIYIVTEYIEGGTLEEYCHKKKFNFTEKQAINIMIQVAIGVKYLHQYGIVHRDLKPDNIMITEQNNYGLIKIIDFGLSKIVSPNEKLKDGYGTPKYIAPEVLLRTPYNKEVDIWSMGITLFYMCSGHLPFIGNSEKELAKKIVNEDLEFEEDDWKKRTQKVVNLISSCLEKKPKERINIDQFIVHPWFIYNIKRK